MSSSIRFLYLERERDGSNATEGQTSRTGRRECEIHPWRGPKWWRFSGHTSLDLKMVLELSRRQFRPSHLSWALFSHAVSARARGADGGRSDPLAPAHSGIGSFCGCWPACFSAVTFLLFFFTLEMRLKHSAKSSLGNYFLAFPLFCCYEIWISALIVYGVRWDKVDGFLIQSDPSIEFRDRIGIQNRMRLDSVWIRIFLVSALNSPPGVRALVYKIRWVG